MDWSFIDFMVVSSLQVPTTFPTVYSLDLVLIDIFLYGIITKISVLIRLTYLYLFLRFFIE